MLQDIGKQAMQRLLQTLLRKDVKNGSKMNFGLNLLARYRAREIGASTLQQRRRDGALRAV